MLHFFNAKRCTFYLTNTGSPRNNGSTAKILGEIARGLQTCGYTTALIILPEQNIRYCIGDKSCFQTGVCIHDDDVANIVSAMYNADLVVIASPSYWGDVTAQMKTFIDRNTPYCNGNPNRKLRHNGIKGAAVAIRAGQNKQENQDLVHTIEHFLGHHDIPLLSSFAVEGIDAPEDLKNRPEILREAYDFGVGLTL